MSLCQTISSCKSSNLLCTQSSLSAFTKLSYLSKIISEVALSKIWTKFWFSIMNFFDFGTFSQLEMNFQQHLLKIQAHKIKNAKAKSHVFFEFIGKRKNKSTSQFIQTLHSYYKTVLGLFVCLFIQALGVPGLLNHQQRTTE